MPAIAFDTLHYVKRLQKAGVSAQQAEAQADVLSEVMSLNLDKLATKEDIKNMATKADLVELKIELKEDIGSLRSEMKEDIGSLRSEMKEDIGSLRSEMKEDIGSLRSELKEDISSLTGSIANLAGQMKMMVWVMGIMAAGIFGLIWTMFSIIERLH